MSKLKQPVISLEAHGTIGGSLTLKRRRGKDLAIRKPVPAYRRTLPQLYQRWDYQDGIAYWDTLTLAQKQTYKSNGAKHHMTGFAYFMSYYLKNLPGLAGRWHLDKRNDTIAPDTSKNNNNGTIFGALWIDGVIGEGLQFDGVDDRVNCGNDQSLRFTDKLSVLAWVNFPSTKPIGYVVSRNIGVWGFVCSTALGWGDKLQVEIGGTTYTLANTFPPSKQDRWTHIAFTFDGATGRVIQYVDAEIVYNVALPATLPVSANDLLIGSRPIAWGYFKGGMDEVHVLNRVLTLADIKRHFERRYP